MKNITDYCFSGIINSLFISIIAVIFTGCSHSEDANGPAPSSPHVAKREDFIASQDDDKRFNVFMIVADALRPDVLGCYGGAAKTPHLDWLAANGMVFDNAYSTSPWTVPSSVSIMTGNHPTIYRDQPFDKSIRISVPSQEVLLAEVLKKLGYTSKSLIDNPNAGLHNNFQGFENIGSRRDGGDISLSASRKKAIFDILHDEIYDWPSYRSTYLWVDELLSLRADQSFFFVEWFLDPHAPYDPVPKFRDAIREDRTQLPKSERIYQRPLHLLEEKFSAYEMQFNKDLYRAEVESIDERVGVIIDSLKAKGLLDSTVVIFTSDHGEQFGEHGKTGHGGFGMDTDYNRVLLKVPLIIMGPGIGKQSRVQETVSLLDLMPTVKEILGVRYDASMQGESFSPLLRGAKIEPRAIYFSGVRGEKYQDAILDGDYKLIMLSNGENELFNVSVDPEEGDNVATQHPEILASLRHKILQIREENNLKYIYNGREPAEKLHQTNNEMQETIKSLKELGYMK